MRSAHSPLVVPLCACPSFSHETWLHRSTSQPLRGSHLPGAAGDVGSPVRCAPGHTSSLGSGPITHAIPSLDAVKIPSMGISSWPAMPMTCSSVVGGSGSPAGEIWGTWKRCKVSYENPLERRPGWRLACCRLSTARLQLTACHSQLW